MKMKKTIQNIIGPALRITAILFMVSMLSCEKSDKEATPNVTGVRYTIIDSIAPITSVGMGATIAIQGSGLKDVQVVKFNSIEKELNPNYVTEKNIIVTVPNNFPAKITNQVCLYTASEAEYCFNFVIEIPEPSITKVNYIKTSADQADIINITGHAFAQVLSITIGTPDEISNDTGTEIYEYTISKNNALLSYNVPATFEFSQTEIIIECVAGTASTSIDWIASLTPSAARITNEYAMVGDTTAIIGRNLAAIESISFGGIPITEYWESEDFETLKFLVPDGAVPGLTTVSATNAFGTVSLEFRYFDTDQMFIDFDTYTVCWDDPTRFDMMVINGDTNRWGYFRGDILPSWWDQPNVLARCDDYYAVFSEVTDPINNLEFKFEINVKKPWSGGGMCRFSFQQTVNDNEGAVSDQEIIYYEWIPEYTDENPYMTDGWQTITIPLSNFSLSADYGSQLDASGLKYFMLRFIHLGSATNTLTDMDVNIDNMRLEIIN